MANRIRLYGCPPTRSSMRPASGPDQPHFHAAWASAELAKMIGEPLRRGIGEWTVVPQGTSCVAVAAGHPMDAQVFHRFVRSHQAFHVA